MSLRAVKNEQRTLSWARAVVQNVHRCGEVIVLRYNTGVVAEGCYIQKCKVPRYYGTMVPSLRSVGAGVTGNDNSRASLQSAEKEVGIPVEDDNSFLHDSSEPFAAFFFCHGRQGPSFCFDRTDGTYATA